MSRVRPFRALRYDLDVVGSLDAVTSPPYDVISDEQQQHYRDASRFNVVQLEFNDHGADSGTRQTQYAHAAARLSEWSEAGALRREHEPSYYPYEMEFHLNEERCSIRGLICAVGIEGWGGSILPHEHVMAKQVQDRLGLIRSTRANVSPIYSVFDGPCRPLEDMLSGLSEPIAEVTDPDGVTHRLWRTDDDGLGAWFEGRDLLIADGHHRYTVALAYQQEMNREHGPGPWDDVMMFIVDTSTQNPPVLPIHRVMAEPIELPNAHPVADLASALAGADDSDPAVGVVTPGPSYWVAKLDGDTPAVSALHSGPLQGMEGGRDMVFTADAEEADRAVRNGASPAAILLPPTSASRIHRVISRGERMPQKSTFFWPKPRTGLVIRAMDPSVPAS